nr:hypothetical protein Itr_chr14CG11340 [Ipomoea trifida]
MSRDCISSVWLRRTGSKPDPKTLPLLAQALPLGPSSGLGCYTRLRELLDGDYSLGLMVVRWSSVLNLRIEPDPIRPSPGRTDHDRSIRPSIRPTPCLGRNILRTRSYRPTCLEGASSGVAYERWAPGLRS